MDRRKFDGLVRQAISSLPREFLKALDNVLVTVENRPSRRLLREMDADDLLGIYLGTPLTERGDGYSFAMPDRVIIFQKSIEAACETEAEMLREIRLTVLHELGHHFGLTDEELDEIEADLEA